MRSLALTHKPFACDYKAKFTVSEFHNIFSPCIRKIIISRNAVFFKTTGTGSRMCKYDTRKDFLQEGSPSIMIEVRRAIQSVFFRTAWLQRALCYFFIRSTYFQTVGSRTTARAIFNKSPGMKGYRPKSRTGLSQPMKLPSHIKPDV